MMLPCVLNYNKRIDMHPRRRFFVQRDLGDLRWLGKEEKRKLAPINNQIKFV